MVDALRVADLEHAHGVGLASDVLPQPLGHLQDVTHRRGAIVQKLAQPAAKVPAGGAEKEGIEKKEEVMRACQKACVW